MLVREILPEEKENFCKVVEHPLQSWEWGEFRRKTGVEVMRLGAFEKEEMKAGYQLTAHPLSVVKMGLKVIYFPKGPLPDEPMLSALRDLGVKQKAVFIRLEPNVGAPVRKWEKEKEKFGTVEKFLLENGCRRGRPLFTPYTFRIDLTKGEEELMTRMKEKTRYNVRLAQRHGVEVVENNSEQAFKTYLKLMTETTERQGFYAHSPDYHKKLWETLKPSGMARLLLAQYRGKTLVAWMILVFKDVLYYPYGASSRESKYTMPGYAMMWEAMKYGKRIGCKTFDLWGSLGPKPSKNDPWYGFHHFKEGFGPELIRFIGTWDLVINPSLYPLTRAGEFLRWKVLRLKTKLPRRG